MPRNQSSLKQVLSTAFPAGAQWYRRFKRGRLRRRSLAEIFAVIYQENLWGDAGSVSGRGSTLERTTVIRGALPALVEEFGWRSMIDAACGDFNWLQHVDLKGIAYTGCDIVPSLIERNRQQFTRADRAFFVLDITREVIPRCDAILCRDCFSHLSSDTIQLALANFIRSRSDYLLATTHPQVGKNVEIENGEWRSINLRRPPFNLPEPIRLIVEDPAAGKCLGIWRLSDLRADAHEQADAN